MTRPVEFWTIRSDSSPVPRQRVKMTRTQNSGRRTGNGGIAKDRMFVIKPNTLTQSGWFGSV